MGISERKIRAGLLVREKRQYNGAISKALAVFDAIVRFGPLTPAEIASVTDLPRLTVYRSLWELKAVGWVRERLGDNAIQLSASFEELAAQARVQSEEVELIAAITRRIGNIHRLHCDVSLVVGRGLIELVESTDKSIEQPARLDRFSNEGLVALSTMSNAQVMRHSKPFMLTDTSMGASPAECSSKRKMIQKISERNHTIFSASESSIWLGFSVSNMSHGCVKLSPKKLQKTPRSVLEQAGDLIFPFGARMITIADLRAHVQTLEAGDS